MNRTELREAAEARDYLLQGLWFQRVHKPGPASVKLALEWALEIASSGQPLLPTGFLADVGSIAFGSDSGKPSRDVVAVPGWPVAAARQYEDFLLGKLYADWSFERGSEALRRYSGGERPRGLAYVVKQFRERAKLGGVDLSPGILRGLLARSPEENLRDGYESLTGGGPHPILLQHYEELTKAARRVGDILGPEDIAALEQRTALADMGAYVAHRQVLMTANAFEERIPNRPVKPWLGRKEVPTRLLDDDQYPVGGYSSISNRGSVESLLHSQLAFMETEESPDLFDVKFIRDELFYYARDENQFLRRRRTFVFVMQPSLAEARFKDVSLPCQRIVLAQALVVTVVRRLADWLSQDWLRFRILFPKPADAWPLAEEAELMTTLLAQWRGQGSASVICPGASDAEVGAIKNGAAVLEACERWARSSQVQVLEVGATATLPERDGISIHSLSVNEFPELTSAAGGRHEWNADDPFDAWTESLIRILQLWI